MVIPPTAAGDDSAKVTRLLPLLLVVMATGGPTGVRIDIFVEVAAPSVGWIYIQHLAPGAVYPQCGGGLHQDRLPNSPRNKEFSSH